MSGPAKAMPGQAAPRPRLDLTCSLITDTDGIGMNELYLVDPNGYRRHLANEASFHVLFRSFDDIKQRADIRDIAEGPEFSADIHIASPRGSNDWFLMTDGKKNPITPAGAAKCDFDYNNVVAVNPILVRDVPVGVTWI
ncbi:hypothetical protein Adu01nite_90240 [Paractinoplanes durhamensis]|uniref:Uncharacterized protein n=1 Tax=Paractinoplanes durhamensis TaxID=113563 RepID=A0ABQ3ZCX8_9ACTN|nr:hypothetical protein Adu01nite_90240 [Actinoplanes durhamensis]